MYRESRNGKDRRKRKIPPLKYLLFGGQRKRIRRKEDEGKLIILDTHGHWVFVLTVIILVLSIIDGLLTLNLIGRGAQEINPVMSYLIDINPYIFFREMLFDHSCRHHANFIKKLSFKNISYACCKSIAINCRVFRIGYLLSVAFEVTDSSFRVIDKNIKILIYSLSR